MQKLNERKRLEREAAAKRASAEEMWKDREAGFQVHLNGANRMMGRDALADARVGQRSAGPDCGGGRRPLRVPGARHIDRHMMASGADEPEPEQRKSRRRWTIGGPLNLRITDGDEKGETVWIEPNVLIDE